jgi:hypothetical protein
MPKSIRCRDVATRDESPPSESLCKRYIGSVVNNRKEVIQ